MLSGACRFLKYPLSLMARKREKFTWETRINWGSRKRSGEQNDADFFCGESGREVGVIFINKQFAALRLSNAKADKCQFFRELFNAYADRTILLPWSPPRTCDPVAHFRRLNHGRSRSYRRSNRPYPTGRSQAARQHGCIETKGRVLVLQSAARQRAALLQQILCRRLPYRRRSIQ